MKPTRLQTLAIAILLASLTRAGDSAVLNKAVQAELQQRPPCCRELAIKKPMTDQSIYLLDSKWTSDVGKVVTLGVLRGRPQILAMFFANCEFACPILVHDIQRIREAMDPATRDAVDVVLISLDPKRDTPAALAEYRKKQHLETAHWTLLTGGEEDVRELAALLGVNYRRDSRGQFAHSNVLFMLNSEGEIAHRQVGLNQDPTQAVSALRKLIPEGSAPRSRE